MTTVTAELNSESMVGIAAMRERHLALMDAEPSHDSETDRAFAAMIETFLREGAALGSRLGSPKERTEAQGMLNYWAATFARMHGVEARVAAAESSSAELQGASLESAEVASAERGGAPFGSGGYVVLAPFDTEAAEQRLAKSVKLLDAATAEERADLEKLLPYLVKMEGGSSELQIAILAEDDSNLAPDGQDRPSTLLLKRAGILMSGGMDRGKQQYALASDSLFAKWPLLKDYRNYRKAFRETAQSWNRTERQTADLLRGEQLQRSERYADLNSVEMDFRKASVDQAKRDQDDETERREKAATAEALQRTKIRKNRTIFAISTIATILAIYSLFNAQGRRLERQRSSEVEAALKKAEEANLQKDESLKMEKALRKKLTEALATETALREKLTTALANEREANAKLKLSQDSAESAALARTLRQEEQQREKLDQLNATIAELQQQIQTTKSALESVNQLRAMLPSRLTQSQSTKINSAINQINSAIAGAEKFESVVQVQADQSAELVQPDVIQSLEPPAEPRPALVRVLDGHKQPITAVDFAADGRLATAGENNSVRVWSKEGDQLDEIPVSESGVTCLDFSPDGKLLAIGSNGSTVRIYDFDAGRTITAYPGHRDTITSVSFAKDSSRVLSTSGDRTVQIWDARSAQSLFTPARLDSIVTSAAFSPDNASIVASLDDPANCALLWKSLQAGSESIALPMKAPVKRASFSFDGSMIVSSGSGDNTAAVWEFSTGSRKFSLAKHTGPVFQAIFDPSGTRVSTASADTRIMTWDLSSVSDPLIREGHDGEVRHLAYSPDGKVLLSGSSDATAKLWFGDEVQARHTLTGHTRRITAVAFNSDGTQIATGSFDGTVRLWDFTKDTPAASPQQEEGWALFGWLDKNSQEPRLIRRSFTLEGRDANTLPQTGFTAVANAAMNIRDEITPVENGRWDQGRRSGILPRNSKVVVTQVLGIEKRADPPAVWIKFRRDP